VTATSNLPSAPVGGLLARRRIAIARFGTDVAAAGGIGPALAAGLDPADYPVVPIRSANPCKPEGNRSGFASRTRWPL
jgi:hypothetical protein